MLSPLYRGLSPLGTGKQRQTWRAYVATLNPYLWYWCTETSGNLTDHGSSNLIAAPTGSPTYNLTGQLGSSEALRINALSVFITASNASWQVTDFEFHYLLFVESLTPGDNRVMGRNVGYRFIINNPGILDIVVPHSGGTAETVTTTAINANTWYLLSWRYQGSTDKKVKAYVNGVEASYSAQPAGVGTLTQPTLGLYWGNNQAVNVWFHGLFDELIMTPHLTDSQRLTMVQLAGL